MNWRRYGTYSAIVITAGAIVTGDFIWNMRSKVVQAQDLAELYAGLHERVCAFHVGTNGLPTYLPVATNALLWQVDVTTNGYTVSSNVTLTVNVRKTLEFPNGNAITISPTSFVFTAADWDTYQTATITVDAGETNYDKYATFTLNACGQDQDYPARITVDASSSQSGASDAQDAYAYYRYYGRAPGGSATLYVKLKAAVTNSAYSGWQAVTNPVLNIVYADPPGAVGAFPLWGTLYNLVMRQARCVALGDFTPPLGRPSDSPSYGMTNALPGEIDDVNVWWIDPDAEIGDGTVLVDVPRSWVLFSAVTNYLVTGSHYQHIFRQWSIQPEDGPTGVVERLRTSVTRWPGTGVVFEPGVSLTNLPLLDRTFCVHATNKLAGAGIADEDNWWKTATGRTNAYRWSCEVTDASNNVAKYNRFFRTNNFTEARSLLRSLRRTMYIADLDQMTYTGHLERVGEYVTNITQNGFNGSPPEMRKASWLADASAGLHQTSQSSEGTVSTIAEFDVDAGELVSDTWLEDREQNTWYRFVNVDVNYRVRQYTGCRLPYPSAAACASGMVSRISIYAVADAAMSGYFGEPDWAGPNETYTPSNTIVTLNGGQVQQDASGLGVFSQIADRPTPPDGPFDILIGSTDQPYWTGFTPASCKLSLIGTWENPAAPPSFSLGADHIDFPTLGEMTLADWTHTDDVGVGRFVDNSWWARYSASVDCRWLVVVVDWDFKHCSTAGYEPPLYVPPGATNSP